MMGYVIIMFLAKLYIFLISQTSGCVWEVVSADKMMSYFCVKSEGTHLGEDAEKKGETLCIGTGKVRRTVETRFSQDRAVGWSEHDFGGPGFEPCAHHFTNRVI